MSAIGELQNWKDLQQQCGNPELTVCSDEAAYLQCWMQNVAQQQDPALMAVKGGMLADRMAWVFVAGYQAALRRTFADQVLPGWAAFAVSEDRRNDPPLPGVDYQQSNGEFVVSGHKTWVAAVDSVEHLIIKAAKGERALYFNLPRKSQGLEFSARAASFLGEMSQGSAHLNAVRLPKDAALDTSEVAQFGVREALYIYLAFLGYAGQRWSQAVSPEDCLGLIRRLSQALAEATLPVAEVKAIDTYVQKILRDISPVAAADNERWDKDQRLISMYSPGIQQRQT
jgi:hypothetical protein